MSSENDRRAAAAETVVQKLRADGVTAVWVDRAPVFDRTTLMHALYQALQLPAWFGFNWDALEEVLFGDDADTTPLVLVFHDLELLEARDPAAAHIFLEIVEAVARDPRSRLQGLVRVGQQ